MANEDTTNTQAETTAANTVVVPVPEPGQVLTVTVDAEQIPQLNFDPGTESTQEFVGTDLVFTLDNGAVLTFEDFAASINDGAVTSIMLEDGSIIPIDALIAAWNLEVPETAAGEAAASGGGSAYGDDMGDALGGIDKLGTQNPDPFGAAALAPVEDEQTPVLDPVNQPPVALDNIYRIEAGGKFDIDEFMGLLTNDYDPDGDPISITFAEAPSNVMVNLADGSLKIDANGASTYEELDEGDTVEIEFPYTITDPSGATSTATVTIIIEGVNDPPVATDNVNEVIAGSTFYYGEGSEQSSVEIAEAPFVEGDMIADDDGFGADSDPDDIVPDEVPVTQISFEGGAAVPTSTGSIDGNFGTLTWNPDGSYRYTVDPEKVAEFGGNDSEEEVFTYTITDDNGASSQATLVITVYGNNDPPAVDLDGSADGTGFSTTFTEGNGAVTIADTDSDITDVDSANLTQMTVTLTNALDGSAESLSIAADDVPDGMTATPAVDGHSITFSGSFTLDQYESVLEAVKYDNSSQDPDTTTRTVNVQVTDDTNLTSNIAVASIAMTPENDPPAVDLDGSADGTGFSTTFTEGNGAVTIADTDSDITDVDSANLTQMTVTLTNALDGSAESLSIAADDVPDGMTATPAVDGHSITFSGSFTLDQYESVLEAVKYDNSSQDPDTTTRTVNVQVTDDTNLTSNIAVASIAMTPVDDVPSIMADDTTVSEEGLDGGNKDTLPDDNDPPVSANDNIDLAANSGTITVTDVDTAYTVDNITLALSANQSLKTADGDDVVFNWVESQDALIGTRDGTTDEIVRISIDSVQTPQTGDEYVFNYTVELSEPVYHSDSSVEDELSFSLDVTAGSKTFTAAVLITIEDDSPLIEGTFDGLMANVAGNSLTADLGIEYGADGPESAQITGYNDGTNDVDLTGLVDGVISDIAVLGNDGNQLTADGIGLVYKLSGGTLQAVMDPDFTPPEGSTYVDTHVAFTVSLDSSVGTYSVSIVDGLDGGPVTTTVGLASGGVPGNTSSGGEYYLEFNDNSVLVVAGDTDGQDTVNRNIHGMGAGNPFVDVGDKLTVELYDTPGGTRIDFGTVTVGTYKLLAGEEGFYQLYNDGVAVTGEIAFSHSTANFTQDPNDSNLGELTITNSGDFDGIVFGSTIGEYTLSTFSATDTSAAYDNSVTYNFSATDSDEDSTTGTFDVTFDGDGTLELPTGADSLALSNGDDVIDLGDIAGASITIDGGAGFDTVAFDNDLDLGDGPLSLTNIEALDFTGTAGNTLTINYQDVLDATEEGDTSLEIYGNADDIVNLVDPEEGDLGTWVEGDPVDNGTAWHYESGNDVLATVVIDDAILSINTDNIP
ncbi:Ig-like domain-containing protein [Deltaproteobacteria bacterium IMCC39524]|nr:Ig-like domain-containing protein [Deltaproteobacteria bacterium IMCC39524]